MTNKKLAQLIYEDLKRKGTNMELISLLEIENRLNSEAELIRTLISN